MVLTPIFAVCCAFYLIIFFHLKNLLFFSNAVAKPLLFYKRFFFFKSLSARTKLARLFCRSALFSSLGRTEGLFPRLKTPKKSLQTRKRVRREVEFSSGRVYTAHQSTVFLFGGLCCQIFMKLFLLKQEIICPIARDFRPFHKKPRFCKIYIV